LSTSHYPAPKEILAMFSDGSIDLHDPDTGCCIASLTNKQDAEWFGKWILQKAAEMKG
jgi:hypothetical protein